MPLDTFRQLHGNLTIPPFLYGTAWKEQDTQRLVVDALNAGFEGIDTANQRKHYFEEGVGLGIQQFLKTTGKTRGDLFLQTKFTFSSGQDHRKPYDESASIKCQVKQSVESSLNHLQTDYIDSYILHGPCSATGIFEEDLDAWTAMEDLVRTGQIKCLGISNVSITQLEKLYTMASIKPSFVQNRCYAITQWDKEIRSFCNNNDMIYQGFSLLTANHIDLSRPLMRSLVEKYEKTVAQIVFRFAIQLKILPLTGTTKQRHMREDLGVGGFELTQQELKQLEEISLSFRSCG